MCCRSSTVAQDLPTHIYIFLSLTFPIPSQLSHQSLVLYPPFLPPGPGLASSMLIKIQEASYNVDPDPKH